MPVPVESGSPAGAGRWHDVRRSGRGVQFPPEPHQPLIEDTFCHEQFGSPSPPWASPYVSAPPRTQARWKPFWRGESSAENLQATAAGLRLKHWQLQRAAGAIGVPVNDFSLYDHVLDAAFLFYDAIPALPRRWPMPTRWPAALRDGARPPAHDGIDLHALEMTKVVRHQLPLPRARAAGRTDLRPAR